MTAPTQDGAPRRPRRAVWKEPPITLGDRLAAAVVCTLAMAATGVAIGLLLLLEGGDVITAEGWRLFFRLQAAFLAFAAAAGFVLGPDRATDLWGRLWGTDGVEGGRGAALVFVAFYVLATVMALFA